MKLKVLKEVKLLAFCSQAPTMETLKAISGLGLAFQRDICHVTQEEHESLSLDPAQGLIFLHGNVWGTVSKM